MMDFSWLACTPLLLFWVCLSAADTRNCDYFHIPNGRVYGNEPATSFPKRVGDKHYYRCDSGFLPPNKAYWQTVTCTVSGWDPEPNCFKKCEHTEPIRNGKFIYGSWTSPFIEGNTIFFSCDKGYYPVDETATATCTKDGWSPPPICVTSAVAGGRCDRPPSINNGDILEMAKSEYMSGEKVHYKCQNLYRMEGTAEVECYNGHWTQPPTCIVAGGRCDRPPSIDNGDIREMAKSEYMSGEKVHYKCQNLYRMEGTAEVECHNGHWTQPPTCIVPCTANEEDMKINNIMLRWRGNPKLYLEAGDRVEFTCRRGYYPDPSSPPFAAECVNGRFESPRCIRRA